MTERLIPRLALVLVVASFAVLFGDVLEGLVRTWRVDDNASHGFLIVPLALYFAWERRTRLAAARPAPRLAGVFILAASVFVLAVGRLGAELFLARVAIVGAISGLVLFLYGREHLRVLWFPIAFLMLMIPLPAIVFNQVAFPLQLLASRVGEASLASLGIPVLREGNVIVLATTNLEVAEACSGIRSLMSLVTLAIVFGYLADRRAWVRMALVASAVPIAIFTNGARVAGTGIAAHYAGAKAATGFFHTFSGWLLFLAAFLMLLAVAAVLRWLRPPAAPAGITPAAAAAPALDDDADELVSRAERHP